MAGYVTAADIKGYLPPEEYAEKGDIVLELQAEAAKDLIDGHLNRDFSDKVPAIVKIVSLDLVRIMLADITKKSENIPGDYSYTANEAAINQVLARLDHADLEDEESNAAKTAVNVMVI